MGRIQIERHFGCPSEVHTKLTLHADPLLTILGDDRPLVDNPERLHAGAGERPDEQPRAANPAVERGCNVWLGAERAVYPPLGPGAEFVEVQIARRKPYSKILGRRVLDVEPE